MKIVKAIGIVLIGALLGSAGGFFIGGHALPPDPNFATNGGHSSPGDGILILGYIVLSLFISVLLSAFLAWFLLFRRKVVSKLN